MRILALFLLISLHLSATAGSFTIHVTAKDFDEQVVSIYRYDDLFTLRTKFVARTLIGGDGTAMLQGEVTGTTKMQLRIGDRSADLFVRDGSNLHVEPRIIPGARSINGSTRMDLVFRDLDRLDINALVTDVNERVDAFLSEDLATDEIGGMQAVDIQRKPGAVPADTAKRPATLFLTPQLSEQKVDSFATKLRRFYAEVQDPWFNGYVDNSIAGLQFGPRVNERTVHERYIKSRPVQYTDPEYVRLVRTMFSGSLAAVARYHADTLRMWMEQGNVAGVVALFQRNDFLKNEDRLAELVMADQLYLNHKSKLLEPAEVEGILRKVEGNSAWPEHRAIAGNMLWDLLTMRNGSALPPMRLEDPQGRAVELDSLLKGPTCLAFTASWCTYCAVEMAGLEKLAKEYPDLLTIIVVDLDQELTAMNAYRKAHPEQKFRWLHAQAEQQVREDLRLRSIPAFFLLNDTTLARSPAPSPSDGLGALFHQLKVEAGKQDKLKVWDE